MDNVIQFPGLSNKSKNGLDEDIVNKIYEKHSDEIYELMQTKTIVAGDIIGAEFISKILMDKDPSIKYCETVHCISRISQFIKVIPVYKESLDNEDIVFIKESAMLNYIDKLILEGRVKIQEDGDI